VTDPETPRWIPGEPEHFDVEEHENPWTTTVMFVGVMFALGIACIVGAFRPGTDLWVSIGLFLVVLLCAAASLYLVVAKIRSDRE
jgi:quinol-cytochrome oxidoreductase complex cytochrome b subunit